MSVFILSENPSTLLVGESLAWVPRFLQKGIRKASASFITSMSIKAVAAVATNDKAAIALHHAISRLALVVLGLRLLTIWRDKRIGVATFATVVRKTRV